MKISVSTFSASTLKVAKPLAAKSLALLMMGSLAACQALAPQRVYDDSALNDISGALEQAKQDNAQNTSGQKPPQSIVNNLLPEGLSVGGEPQGEERFDVNVDGVDARAFFQGLVQDTRYNVVVHPDVAGRISISLQDVSVPEVLNIVRDVYGYAIKRSANIYTVMPAGVRTEVFKINYLNLKRGGSSETRVSSGSVSDVESNSNSNTSTTNSVDDDNRSSQSNGGSLIGTQIRTTVSSDFWSELKQSLDLLVGSGEGQKVVVTPQSGMVIVKGLPADIEIVRDYLQSAELIMRRQVILEAKILEVTLNDQFQAGINWSALPEAGNSLVVSQGVGASNMINQFNAFELPGSTGITDAGDVNSVFGISVDVDDFSGIIDLLETQGTVQVLSSPRISTVNNQKAVIKVGTDEFFVTDVTNTVTTSTGGTTNIPSIELTPFFSGIALDVTPQISENDEIILHVHPTVSEVVEQQRNITIDNNGFDLPLAQSSIRESDSIIFAQNDQVVVIGGLIQNVATDNNAGAPWVSKIPLVGSAFKQKAQKSVKRELVILLRPKVLSADANNSAIAESLERIEKMRSEINYR